MERNAIVNADAEVHDAIEHLESASAMQVDTEDDATKVYIFSAFFYRYRYMLVRDFGRPLLHTCTTHLTRCIVGVLVCVIKMRFHKEYVFYSIFRMSSLDIRCGMPEGMRL